MAGEYREDVPGHGLVEVLRSPDYDVAREYRVTVAETFVGTVRSVATWGQRRRWQAFNVHSLRVGAQARSVRLAVVELLRRQKGVGSTDASCGHGAHAARLAENSCPSWCTRPAGHDLGGDAGTWPGGEVARDHARALATAGAFEVDLVQWDRLAGPYGPLVERLPYDVGVWVSGNCALDEVPGRAAGLRLLAAAASRAADALDALEVRP